MENLLQDTTIQRYINMLKTGKDPMLAKEISELLSSKISGVSGGFDLQLFQIEKDLLLFQCKYLLAMFDFDNKKMAMYAEKIEMLRIARKKKQKKAVKVSPYESFLQWLFTLKKYYGSEVDRSNTLFELVVATESMMKWYGSQSESIEKQKAKK